MIKKEFKNIKRLKHFVMVNTNLPKLQSLYYQYVVDKYNKKKPTNKTKFVMNQFLQ